MKGKTIRLYLTDGVPTGILTAEIINWTGKVIVAPRSNLADLARRDEARRTGVYCLVGPDPETIGKDRVYLGEADNVLVRLTSHDRDPTKDFWTRAVLIISKDENVTKSHRRYLESRLIQLAIEPGRASLANLTAPPVPPLPEPDIADMEFFLEQVQMMLPVLGFSFLMPKPAHRPPPEAAPQSPTFELRIAGTHAKAIESNGFCRLYSRHDIPLRRMAHERTTARLGTGWAIGFCQWAVPVCVHPRGQVPAWL